MMTLSKQMKFKFNSLLEDVRGSLCCVIKVRQYMFDKKKKPDNNHFVVKSFICLPLHNSNY